VTHNQKGLAVFIFTSASSRQASRYAVA